MHTYFIERRIELETEHGIGHTMTIESFGRRPGISALWDGIMKGFHRNWG
jgi:hypothetical protein